MPELKYRTCNLCEAMCGLVMTVDGGRITDVRADRDDPFSRGHICPKGPAMREVYEDPDRLRHPMRRTAAGWERVSWDDALDEAAARLAAIRARDGGDALGLYLGNPTVHSHGAMLAVQGFARALDTRNRFDANSQDANPKLFACMFMYGAAGSITLPDVDRTDYFLMLGANPAASNGSLMTLGDVKGRIQGIRGRGGRVVLIDPRRTETAAWCDEHHFIKPGADAALLFAVINVLFAEKLVDRVKVSESANGVDLLESLASPFSPERVAAAVGLEAAAIRRIALDFARARAAVAYGRVGLCTNEFGAAASWLIEALNVVSGNFDRAGGAMFSRPAVELGGRGRRGKKPSYARWRSRVRGLPEFAGLLPGAAMIEEMETPGRGQIRGFITFAGNPVLSTTNGERLAAALAGLEYMVSIDYYINETTRHAHLILPPSHALERGHFDLVFNALAVRNTVKWSEPVVAPAPDAREDWRILYDLGMRLGGLALGPRIINEAARLAWRAGLRLSPERVIDVALRLGPYGDRFRPWRGGLSLKKLARAPHGIDLGPLEPSRAARVRTADGKVELAPAVLAADVPRLARFVDERRAAGLVLIGRRHVRSNNSWMHNCVSLVKGPDRSALLMNPADADARGLADGQTVRVSSRVGAVEARVERTDDVMPGVVSLPHGFGHAAAKETLRVAGATRGVNMNALTDERLLEPITGTAVLNGVPVSVEPL